MKFQIVDVELRGLNLATRIPFKYGIATMTRAPHVFLRVLLDYNGTTVTGVAADLLPPKWFTKDPDKSPDDEIDDMLAVIGHAMAAARGMEASSAFDLWRQLSIVQSEWGRGHGFPPLLTNFGTSFVERAVIEAASRAAGLSFAQMVHTNRLGIRLAELDSRLAGYEPGDLLPAVPARSVTVRQTVGLADSLRTADIARNEQPIDGLPQSFADCLDVYGLRHAKIKLSGDCRWDCDRITDVSALMKSARGIDFAFSLDGNEHFRSLDAFRSYWQTLIDVADVRAALSHQLFVEQPFHRDVALNPEILDGLTDWHDRPPLIIDESDAETGSLTRALELGYHGTSHKNCKGVFKSVGNACLLEYLRRQQPDRLWLLSAEDLVNVGPVALPQDLVVSATLGVPSVERNGHHYFAGLSAFPDRVQRDALLAHPDLYRTAEPGGWPTVALNDGMLQIGSVIDAPFGVGWELDVEQFLTVDQLRGIDNSE